MNIFHDIAKERITAEDFVVAVEIPKGTAIKYELDKETGMLYFDRLLKTSMVYPANYGMIPRTLGGDNDPIDVMIIGNYTLEPLALVRCRPLGMIEMIDNNEADEKVIAVAVKDHNFSNVKDIKDLPAQTVAEISHFLKSYKALQDDNNVVIKPAKDKTAAVKLIATAMQTYNKKYSK